MDRKTLEYMGKRSQKARDLVKRIDALYENIQNTSDITGVNLISNRNSIFIKHPEIVGRLVDAFVDAAEEEKERLEKELAEL